ncbi:nuclear transport factor 2 family protein [Nocardia sp. NPDC051030]|uniref:nuclear transport factor 2 family protein n=1 Tax=Nocardia sp. NPDC051030 TaxID=3155162 RepID=UPI0034182BEF
MDDTATTITEVAQVVLRERQARDRGWWTRMQDYFAPDSTVRLSWFDGSGTDFVEQSRAMAEHGTRSQHRTSPPLVEVVGDRAVAELPTAIEIRLVLDSVPLDLTSYARLIYRLEHRADRWIIVSLDAIYERDTITPVHPGTAWTVDPEALTGFRASYPLLAHVVGHLGYPVDHNLYGDDRPEPVATFYEDLADWLRTG